MRKFRRPALAVALAAGVVAAAVAAVAVRGANAETSSTFVATLTGAEETPPHATPATGVATVSITGNQITYEVRVFNLSNIVAAHIHIGAPGVAGPIVLTFVTPTPLVGPFAGTLTSKTFVNPPLEGPLAGQPFSALVAQIAAGNAYVNVHTSDNIAPPNTGPGDFPGGEIRGQLAAETSATGNTEVGRGRGRGR